MQIIAKLILSHFVNTQPDVFLIPEIVICFNTEKVLSAYLKKAN